MQRKLPRKRLLLVLLVAALGTASAGWAAQTVGSSGAGPTRSAKAPVQIQIGLIGKLVGYWPMWVALQEGYFKQNLIDPHFAYVDTDARLTTAVVAGAVDLDPETVFVNYSANAHGGDLRMFCGNQNLPYYRLIARKGMTMADIKGKVKIGVSDSASGVDAFVLREWMTKLGKVEGTDYVLFNAGGLANRVAALTAGAIGATALVPPFDSAARAAGLADLGASVDVVKPFLFTAWTAKASWLKKNRPLAEAFCRAIIRGGQFLANPANKDKAIKDLVDAGVTTQATATLSYDTVRPTLSLNGSVDRHGVAPWVKYLPKGTKLKDVTKMIDLSIWKAALARVTK
jgi:NitT/TauT family transport system substrate-binding protein